MKNFMNTNILDLYLGEKNILKIIEILKKIGLIKVNYKGYNFVLEQNFKLGKWFIDNFIFKKNENYTKYLVNENVKAIFNYESQLIDYIHFDILKSVMKFLRFQIREFNYEE